MQIFAVALEEGVLLDVQHDVEIARRAAEDAGFALVGVENARAFLDTGRDFHRDGAIARDASLAAALRAGIDDKLARAAAGLAGARDGEEALLIAHLPASAASGAVDGRLAGRDAAALALVALFQAAHLHLLGDAEDRFLELQRQIFAQIGAALRARATAAALPPNMSPKPKRSPKMSWKSLKTVGSKPPKP